MPGLAHTLIDRVAAEFGQGEWQAEITAAREEHDRVAGKLFEDDGEIYEQRMAAFVEWYVAERPLTKAGKPPALVVLERAGSEAGVGLGVGLTAEEQAALAAILASHRSVFEVTAVQERELVVCDLIGGARFLVRERRSTVGFDVGDLVEARLICVGGGDQTTVAFGKTFMFHPRDAREGVLGIIAAALAAGEGRAEIVGRLARVYLRWRRQREVGAERLYKEAIGK